MNQGEGERTRGGEGGYGGRGREEERKRGGGRVGEEKEEESRRAGEQEEEEERRRRGGDLTMMTSILARVLFPQDTTSAARIRPSVACAELPKQIQN